MMQKFRVWDTVKKAMSDVQAVVYTEERVYPIYSKAIRRYIPFSEAVLMQSAGLFDKNGKEIFEGDVVNIFDEKLSKIYYSEGAFCVEVLNGGTPLHVYLSEHLELIGNIYENPELVEVE
ncbi:TPA: hypothetical protein U1B93_000924 [Streptococcus suis]|nr:hypothetical protein [Streptococcus suis]HEM3585443.1 hypothetical protein [Streptococcus suis]